MSPQLGVADPTWWGGKGWEGWVSLLPETLEWRAGLYPDSMKPMGEGCKRC